MSDATIYGILQGKGGVGKTTTVLNLTTGHAIMEQTNWTYQLGDPIPQLPEEEDATELGIDMDPQKDFTKGSGVYVNDEDKDENTIHELHLEDLYVDKTRSTTEERLKECKHQHLAPNIHNP